MDYVAGAALGVEQIAGIVEGIARGCRAHDMALAGGETAQMPGLYRAGHFDLAGTIVGVVEEDEALHGDQIVPGDVLLGYASTGLHTNGYTLARRIVFEQAGPQARATRLPRPAQSVADALLAVHRSYVPSAGAGARPGARAGAHHRRRHRRQPGAGAAGGLPRAVVDAAAGSGRRSSGSCRRRASRRASRRCATCSTSASG